MPLTLGMFLDVLGHTASDDVILTRLEPRVLLGRRPQVPGPRLPVRPRTTIWALATLGVLAWRTISSWRAIAWRTITRPLSSLGRFREELPILLHQQVIRHPELPGIADPIRQLSTQSYVVVDLAVTSDVPTNVVGLLSIGPKRNPLEPGGVVPSQVAQLMLELGYQLPQGSILKLLGIDEDPPLRITRPSSWILGTEILNQPEATCERRPR